MSALATPHHTSTGRAAGPTGERVELARYTLPGGDEHILWGQRVDGRVRFLPEDGAVLDCPLRAGEEKQL